MKKLRNIKFKEMKKYKVYFHGGNEVTVEADDIVHKADRIILDLDGEEVASFYTGPNFLGYVVSTIILKEIED